MCAGDIISDRKPRHKQEQLRYIWALLLGLAGLVDILGSIYNETCSLEDEQCEMVDPGLHSYWKSFTAWLDRHDILISFVFSALWFLDAFWTANKAKRHALERQEYQLLNKRKEEITLHWWHHPKFAYFWTISLQLLCLPVGFYGALYFGLHRMALGGTLHDLEHLEDDVFDVVEMGDDGTEHSERFSVRSKKAFIFVILQYFAGRTAHSVTHYVKSRIIDLVRTLSKRIVSKAIFNPLKFRRQVKKALKIARYLKYGFPLFGKLNRIRGLVTLAWKRQRQRHEAKKAKRARRLLWESKPREVREVDAAIMIQSAFRAQRARKTVKAMKIFKADKEYIAVAKIQHVLRRKLRERRAHLEAQRKELQRLEQLKGLTEKERLRIYQLRHEVLYETKVLLDRKMLMRPNTKFSVYWKLFFAICLLWELTGAALQPLLLDKAPKSPKHEDKPATVEELFAQAFVPTRVSDWPRCQIIDKEDEHGLLYHLTHKDGNGQHNQNDEDTKKDALPWYCSDPFYSSQESFRDFLALALIPKPVSEWSECTKDPTSPRRRFAFFGKKNRQDIIEAELHWYCENPYSRMHQLYRSLVDWFWSEFVVLVGLAYFLDVFITFFTGEFHPANGVLVPKPFFVRWILPGLVLQLAVNPYMKTVAGWTSDLFRSVLKLGPIRVYRWSATVFFPLLHFVWKHSMQPLWLCFVEFENKYNLIPDDVLF